MGVARNAAKKKGGVRTEEDVFDTTGNFEGLWANRKHESGTVGRGTGSGAGRASGNAGGGSNFVFPFDG